MSFHFEWDAKKAASGFRKHGVSFDEAATVFRDPLAAIFPDPDHSERERREIIIGRSIVGRLLIVSFTEREPNVIRLITARAITAHERHDYEENKR